MIMRVKTATTTVRFAPELALLSEAGLGGDDDEGASTDVKGERRRSRSSVENDLRIVRFVAASGESSGVLIIDVVAGADGV